jgi:hypothetical protein
MNPLPLVTIGVRFLGLVLALLHVGSVGQLVLTLVSPLVFGGPVGLQYFLLDSDPGRRGATPVLVQLALFSLGLYLFLSGRWVIGRLTRGLAWPGGGTCHRCGYDVTGIESARCPECGAKLLPRPSQ